MPVSVPGAVDGWFELHARYGSLSMNDILEPAISYAEAGFPVSAVIAAAWLSDAESRAEFPGFRDTFMPNGKAPVTGQMFCNPRLANTYRMIAADGRDAFYTGDIAHKIDSYMTEHDGFLRHEDLAAHESEWVAPVSTNYRGYEVYELPPNTQGIAALQLLNLLEGYDLAAMGFGSTEYVHTFVEAKKIVYADRARYYADTDFFNVPVEWLISKEYANERRTLIDPKMAAQACAAGDAGAYSTTPMPARVEFPNATLSRSSASTCGAAGPLPSPGSSSEFSSVILSMNSRMADAKVVRSMRFRIIPASRCGLRARASANTSNVSFRAQASGPPGATGIRTRSETIMAIRADFPMRAGESMMMTS